MNEQLSNLFATLKNLPPRPDNIAAYVVAAPAVGTLPPPDLTWSLFAVLHYWQRQAWAYNLMSGMPEILTSGAKGTVPGLPGWAYCVEGPFAEVRHEQTAELIKFCIDDSPGSVRLLWLWTYLGSRYVTDSDALGLKRFSDVELDVLLFSLEILSRYALLELTPVLLYARPSRMTTAYIEPIQAFLAAWSIPEDRLWLGAMIGDWITVEDAARSLDMPEIAALAALRAEACRVAWRDLIRREADDQLSSFALDAVRICLPDELPRYIERVLNDPEPTPETVTAALSFDESGSAYCPEVYRLVMQSKVCLQHLDMSEFWAPYLLENDYRVTEVLQHLLTLGDPPCRLLIQETLVRRHELLRPVLHRVLRCTEEVHSMDAAAVLSLIGEPWTLVELVEALNTFLHSDDWYGCWTCLAALRASPYPEIRKCLDAYVATHRHSWDDLWDHEDAASFEQDFREKLDEWRPLVSGA